MTPELDEKLKQSEALAQTATRCYLSTLMAATDSMTEACPEIGVTFKRRWARAPHRVGFEPTAVSLEETCRTFEQDLQAFASYAGTYFRPAVPLVNRIMTKSGEVADAVLDRVATYSVLLDTLADSLAATADMEAPAPVRKALEHQAAGLASCARRIETELLPLIGELQTIFRDSERIMSLAKESAIADVDTGLLNPDGLAQEIERRRADGSLGCFIHLNVSAAPGAGGECPDEQFAALVKNLSGSVFEQFRADESIGLVGRKFLVLFGGTLAQAEGRKKQIERGLSGVHPVNGVKVKVKVTLEVTGPELLPAEIVQRKAGV